MNDCEYTKNKQSFQISGTNQHIEKVKQHYKHRVSLQNLAYPLHISQKSPNFARDLYNI